MSSDGASDKPRSSRPARGDDRGAGQIALAVLLILALVATVIMVFSENPVWMRIGTLAALWAAFIGAFLVSRYRRQAATEAARVRDLHTVYELQLEREISARREHELVVEKDLRDSIRAETSDSILALRHEIAALREQLGQLGVTLPEDRFAVGGAAPAGELGSRQSLPSVPSERVEPRRRAPEPAGEARPSGSGSTAVSGVGPESTPSTERTARFSPVGTDSAAAADSGAADSGAAAQRRPAVRPAKPAAAAQPQHQPEPAKPQAAQQQPAPATPQTAQQQPKPATPAAPAPTPAAEPEPVHSRHGEGQGLSVAELMARLGGENADSASGGRRHRRRAD